ncbi:LOW QUALITY PROTEIN: uncharacterized protein LOC117316357 [Pecten maximus]|uniref:LOW QUALITY PROTEIN: uncharacterized protein LOC117316357 n=1 Tax=Pecten maximus TaxID=6579 RepID=UPI00145833EB|nr:LOW QUALITY PROTEIN: uncharacterized protein LOC117316357 [Pecten maximus]
MANQHCPSTDSVMDPDTAKDGTLTSDTPCPKPKDSHLLYERRARHNLQLSDPGKALANVVEAVKHKKDSFTVHWLAAKAYASMTMYDDGICAFSNALELCYLEDKRREILTDLLVLYCSRGRDMSVLGKRVTKQITSGTWATVAYDLTRTKMFNEAYIAYSQLKTVAPYQSNIQVNLQPLCDVDTVTKEVWILDLVTCLIRHGSDHNTMTSHAGDTYIQVVVRMTLATGELGLLNHVLRDIVRQGELDDLRDCLGNTSLHTATQYQKCSPIVRMDVMRLLVDSGIDETLENSERKTAASYLLRSEKNLLRCHHDYISICSEMIAEKAMQTVTDIYRDSDIASSEEDDQELEEQTYDGHTIEQQTQTKERAASGTVSPTHDGHATEQETNEDHTTEQETHDGHATEQQTHDGHTTEQETHDGHATEQETNEDHTTEQETHDGHATEQETHEDHTTEQETHDGDTTEQQTHDGHTTEQTHDGHTTEQQTHDGHTTEQETHEDHTAEQQTHDGHTTEQETHEDHTTEQETHEDHTTEQETHVDHTIEQETHEDHNTEQETHEDHTTEQETHEDHNTEQETHEDHTTEQETHEDHTTEQETHEDHNTEQETHEDHTTEQETHEDHTTEQETHEDHNTEQETHVDHTTEQETHVDHTTEQEIHVDHTTEQETHEGNITEQETHDGHTTEQETHEDHTTEQEQETPTSGRAVSGTVSPTNDGHTTEKETHDGHTTEQETHEDHPTEQETHEVHTIEQETHEDHTTEQETHEDHTTEQETHEGHTTEQETHEGHTTEQETHEGHTTEQETHEGHTTEQETHEGHTTEQVTPTSGRDVSGNVSPTNDGHTTKQETPTSGRDVSGTVSPTHDGHTAEHESTTSGSDVSGTVSSTHDGHTTEQETPTTGRAVSGNVSPTNDGHTTKQETPTSGRDVSGTVSLTHDGHTAEHESTTSGSDVSGTVSSTHDGHTTEKETHDGHTTEQETHEDHPTEQETHEVHTIEQETHEDHTTEQETHEDHTTEQETHEGHTTEQETHEGHTTEQETHEGHTTEQETHEGHTTEQETHEGHTTEQVTPTSGRDVSGNVSPTNDGHTTEQETPTSGRAVSGTVSPTHDGHTAEHESTTSGSDVSGTVSSTHDGHTTEQETPTTGRAVSGNVSPTNDGHTTKQETPTSGRDVSGTVSLTHDGHTAEHESTTSGSDVSGTVSSTHDGHTTEQETPTTGSDVSGNVSPTNDGHTTEQQTPTAEGIVNEIVSPQKSSTEQDVSDNNTENNNTDLVLQESNEVSQMSEDNASQIYCKQDNQSHTLCYNVPDGHSQNDENKSSKPDPEENFTQNHTTTNKRQDECSFQEEGRFVKESMGSSQDVKEESTGIYFADGHIVTGYYAVESNPKVGTIFMDEVVEPQVEPTQTDSDVQVHDSQVRARNEQDSINEEKPKSLQNSSVESDQCTKTLRDDLKDKPTRVELHSFTKTDDHEDDKQYTISPRVQALFDRDNLSEETSSDDPEGEKMTSVQENDDKCDRHSSGLPSNEEKPQTGMGTESRASDSKLKHGASHNEDISDLGQVRTEELRDTFPGGVSPERFQCGRNGPLMLEDMNFTENDCKHSHHDVIVSKTNEAGDDEISIQSSKSPSEHSEDIATADYEGTQGQLNQGHHDETDGVQHPRINNLNETKAEIQVLFREGKSWLVDLKQNFKGFEVLGKLLEKTNLLATNKYAKLTIHLICKHLDDCDDKDVPECLVHIPEKYLKKILKLLLDERKWNCFLSIIRKHRECHGSKPLFADIVDGLCLEVVISDSKFRKHTKRLENLIKCLLDIGASMPNEGNDCIRACVSNAHYGVLPLLLSREAHPKHLTMYHGDTPIHAAASIALKTGYFEVFEILLKKFKDDPQGHCECDPTEKDRNGDGILHITLRHPDDRKSRQLIKLVLQHLPKTSTALSRNNKGQYPSDLINEKRDERWRLLESVFPSFFAEQKMKKISRKTARRRKGNPLHSRHKTKVPEVDFPGSPTVLPSNEIDGHLSCSNSSMEKNKIPKDLAEENIIDHNENSVPDKPSETLETVSSSNYNTPTSSILIESDDTSYSSGSEMEQYPSSPDPVQSHFLNPHPTGQQKFQPDSRETEYHLTRRDHNDGKPSKHRPKLKQDDNLLHEEREQEDELTEKGNEDTEDVATEYPKENQQISDESLKGDAALTADKNVVHEDYSISTNKNAANEGILSSETNGLFGIEHQCGDVNKKKDEARGNTKMFKVDDDREHGNIQTSEEQSSTQTKLAHGEAQILESEPIQVKIEGNEEQENRGTQPKEKDKSEKKDIDWEIAQTNGEEFQEDQQASEFLDKISSKLEDLPFKVECSKSFWKTMTSKMDRTIEDKILKIIVDLASGDWHPSIAKELHSPKNVKLYESKIGKGSRLIWQKAIISHTERGMFGSNETPGDAVIRIWYYVASHDDIHKYVFQCLSCPKIPSSSTPFHQICWHISANDPELAVDFPFRVTDLQQAIINLESEAPILLIGRSGTGKTTCCMFRMWNQFIGHLALLNSEDGSQGNSEQAARMSNNVTDSGMDISAEPEGGQQHVMDDSIVCQKQLHQIFLTRNAVLCSEAKKNFNKMRQGSSIARKFDLSDDASLPWRFDDIRDSQYPLFLTLEQLLNLMDASIGPPFFYERENDGSRKGSRRNLFEEDLSISGLPDGIQERVANVHTDSLNSKRKFQQPTEVTFKIFRDIVWPKLASGANSWNLRLFGWSSYLSSKDLMNHSCNQKVICRAKVYLDVGRKRAPNFDGVRQEIYCLFEKYQKVLTKQNLFDECDLVHSINSRLQPKHAEAWEIHQLFVDEIQDFTQAEICLLIKICQDPNQMFLTGDTAQTVMHGIQFRFCDIRSMFYNIREAMKTCNNRGTYLVNVPDKVYQLTQSYRFHDGILALSSSILDIMAHLFPDSFDRLKTDKGLIEAGPLPVLLESLNFSELVMHISGKENQKDDDSDIELGVHQAILVNNEAALQQIPRQLQKNITLTIYESKGLEFNNIFLFNFFKFSSASKEWRAVSTLLTELAENETSVDILRTGMHQLDEGMLCGKGRPRAQTFNPKLHKALNSELKLLYTALTRARVNVLIFDEDEEKRRPMFEYFKARNLVTVGTGYSTQDHTEHQCEKDDWLARGEDFMKKCLYREAVKCFSKGGDNNLATLANAHFSKETALKLRDKKSRQEKFLKAAKLFRSVDISTDKRTQTYAMECIIESGDFGKAAEYCEEIGQYGQAAKIYNTRLKQPVTSSECYEKAQRFDEAVDILYESGYYEKAIDVVSRYTEQIKTLESKNEEIPKLMTKHQPCKKHALEHLRIKSANVYHQRYSNDQKKKYEEASMLYLSNGKSEKALTVARKSGNTNLIAQYLLTDTQIRTHKDPLHRQSQTLRQVNELIDLLIQLPSNNKLKGQTYLLKAELLQTGGNDKEGQSALVTAREAFKRCNPPCIAGQVDCLALMLKLDANRYNISSAVEAMHFLFLMVECLEKTFPTYDDIRVIEDIYNYFGFECNKDRLTLRKNSHHHLAPEMISHCQTENEHDVKKAISEFWKRKASTWYTKINNVLKSLRKNIKSCSCNDEFSKEPCKSNYSLTFGSMKTLLEIDLLQIELHGYIAQTSQTFIDIPVRPCRAFFHHLQPQNFVKCLGSEERYRLADIVRNTKRSVKQTLIKEMQQECVNMTGKERKWSTGLFMKQHFLVNYLQLDWNVRENMEKFVQDLYIEMSKKSKDHEARARLHHLGCLTNNKKVESLAVRFVDAYDQISEDMNPMDALKIFTAFLKLLRGVDRVVLPDRNYLVMWMEYFFVVGSYLIGKADHNVHFVLPTSYINITHYIDSSFSTREMATLEAIKKTKRKRLEVWYIQRRMEIIASFLCGEDPKSGLMNEVFISTQKDVEVIERVLMLSLTCLCNMGNLIQTALEPRLLRQLRSIQLPHDAPVRLTEAVEALKVATGPLAIGNAYRKLLFERGEGLGSYSLWWGSLQFTSLTILNDILPTSFYEEATRILLQTPDKATSGECKMEATGTDKEETKEEDTSVERNSVQNEKATGMANKESERDTLKEICDVKPEETKRVLFETPDKAVSGESYSTRHEVTTDCLLRTPVFYTSGPDYTENVDDSSSIQTERGGHAKEEYREKDKDDGIDWFSQGASNMTK